MQLLEYEANIYPFVLVKVTFDVELSRVKEMPRLLCGNHFYLNLRT